MICRPKQKQITVSIEAANRKAKNKTKQKTTRPKKKKNRFYTAHFFWGSRRRRKTTGYKLGHAGGKLMLKAKTNCETGTRVASFVTREV